jgi:hypothetical protein
VQAIQTITLKQNCQARVIALRPTSILPATLRDGLTGY